MGETRVMGVDASLTSTGFCLVPATWGGDWRKCVVAHAGYSLTRGVHETTRIRRLDDIRGAMALFIGRHEPTHVIFEDITFTHQAMMAHALERAELMGVLKLQAAALVDHVEVVKPNVARKILGPKLHKKATAHVAVHAMGCPKDWLGDEVDAWVTANYLLSELGSGALIASVA